MNPNPQLSRLVAALHGFHSMAAVMITAFGHDPIQGSKAATESPHPEYGSRVSNAYTHGTLMFEVAIDHLSSFVRNVTEPVLTIAPWASIRAEMEACTGSQWLLDNAVDARERLARSFAWRFGALHEQLKYARARGDEGSVQKPADRLDDVVRSATSLGFEETRSRDGDLLSVGVRRPKFTELIGSALGQEVPYRLLSAMAHGHHWAIQQLAFSKRIRPEGLFLEKTMP